MTIRTPLAAIAIAAALATTSHADVVVPHADRGAFVVAPGIVATAPDGFRAAESPSEGDNFQLRAFNAELFQPGAGIVETERNFHTFDLSGLSGTVDSATLRIFAQAGSYDSSAPLETVDFFDVTTPATVLTDPLSDTVAALGAFTDLGSGVTYGSVDVTASDNNSFVEVSLNPSAIAALNAAVGVGSFSIGGALQTIDGSFLGPVSERVFQSEAGQAPSAQLVLIGSVIPEPSAMGLLLATLAFGAARHARGR